MRSAWLCDANALSIEDLLAEHDNRSMPARCNQPNILVLEDTYTPYPIYLLPCQLQGKLLRQSIAEVVDVELNWRCHVASEVAAKLRFNQAELYGGSAMILRGCMRISTGQCRTGWKSKETSARGTIAASARAASWFAVTCILKRVAAIFPVAHGVW